MGSNQIEAFCSKYKEKMNEPIVRNFLKDKRNNEIFEDAILNSTEENTQLLNSTFAEYYRQVKVINYISKLVKYYSIDIEKKITLNKKRNVLILDGSVKDDDDNSNKMDVLTSSEGDLTYYGFELESERLKDHLDNDLLHVALEVLSDKQFKILSLLYMKDLTNKQVAEIMKESEQTISYNHKAAIEKLQKVMLKNEMKG
ncbi:sigma-70 family RNA polymerase sigma factor [Bacillus cereus group sp. N24]|uniref:sigma-70 family RNA polymerase sigma factor n=1 Tax=Bacillus cereus group sp. N24 TaxID=2794592 RepID=UPI0018F6CDD6|nr:sigma-70 family RNA polymerase sigma factor [Bacillus cereus group sp. N24]MBJ7950114.1 sigma-70 family RNA polymerase sigma factor [Bacillus cereus group sp. N24]